MRAAGAAIDARSRRRGRARRCASRGRSPHWCGSRIAPAARRSARRRCAGRAASKTWPKPDSASGSATPLSRYCRLRCSPRTWMSPKLSCTTPGVCSRIWFSGWRRRRAAPRWSRGPPRSRGAEAGEDVLPRRGGALRLTTISGRVATGAAVTSALLRPGAWDLRHAGEQGAGEERGSPRHASGHQAASPRIAGTSRPTLCRNIAS